MFLLLPVLFQRIRTLLKPIRHLFPSHYQMGDCFILKQTLKLKKIICKTFEENSHFLQFDSFFGQHTLVSYAKLALKVSRLLVTLKVQNVKTYRHNVLKNIKTYDISQNPRLFTRSNKTSLTIILNIPTLLAMMIKC